MLNLNPPPTPADPVTSPYMKYPSWLYKPGLPHAQLFTDEAKAKEHYALFFQHLNSSAQISICQELINKLKDLEVVYNPYDYSFEGLKFGKTVIEKTIADWTAKYKTVFEDIPIIGKWATVLFIVGEPIVINADPMLEAMLEGNLPFDIIHQHQVTEALFTAMTRKLIIYNSLIKPKENT